MKRRFVYVLSMLLLAMLFCALLPAAYADDACICASAQEPDPVCTCGCGGEQRAARKTALDSFLGSLMAAEYTCNPGEQAALYREAVENWNAYMDIVRAALGQAPAASEEAPAPASEPKADIYPDTAPAAVEERQAAAAEAAETSSDELSAEEQQVIETMDKLLSGYLTYNSLAEQETDPVRQRMLYEQARQCWSEYMHLTYAYSDRHEAEEQAQTEAQADAQTDDVQTEERYRRREKYGPKTGPEKPVSGKAQASPEDEDVYLTEPLFGMTNMPVIHSRTETREAADIYADQKPVRVTENLEKPASEKNGEIIILYTADVRCAIDEGFGYASLKAMRDSLEAQGYTTILVDGGDAVEGAAIGTMSQGEAIIDFMNALAYDVAIPGDHETDYGPAQFLKLSRAADFPYISCNFALDGEAVLEPFVIFEAEGRKIAFVGVTMPQEDSDVCGALQNAVDSARQEGAEYVYAIGHTDAYAGVTAADIIANTTGIDVFLDNSGTEPVCLPNKEGEDVTVVTCGERLSGIGYSRINAAGLVEDSALWSWPNNTSAAMLFGVDNDISEMVQAARRKLEQEAEQKPAAEAPAPEAAEEEIYLSDEDAAMIRSFLRDYFFNGSMS